MVRVKNNFSIIKMQFYNGMQIISKNELNRYFLQLTLLITVILFYLLKLNVKICFYIHFYLNSTSRFFTINTL